jgi:hypothetical protein
MKALVCGGRGFSDADRMTAIMDAAVKRLGITEIIQGGAPGADFLAKRWAKARSVPCSEFLADWDHFGKAAGPMRNRLMLEEGKPDLVIAFAGGAGTGNMVRIATAAGIRVIEVSGAGAVDGET